jgi:hypothetical protein
MFLIKIVQQDYSVLDQIVISERIDLMLPESKAKSVRSLHTANSNDSGNVAESTQNAEMRHSMRWSCWRKQVCDAAPSNMHKVELMLHHQTLKLGPSLGNWRLGKNVVDPSSNMLGQPQSTHMSVVRFVVQHTKCIPDVDLTARE